MSEELSISTLGDGLTLAAIDRFVANGCQSEYDSSNSSVNIHDAQLKLTVALITAFNTIIPGEWNDHIWETDVALSTGYLPRDFPNIHPDHPGVKGVIVYVASSPGYSIGGVMSLFEGYAVVFIDPAKSAIEHIGDGNVFKFHKICATAEVMTNIRAQVLRHIKPEFHEKAPIILISDLRGSYSSGADGKVSIEGEMAIARDQRLQNELVMSLRPIGWSLKLRPTYAAPRDGRGFHTEDELAFDPANVMDVPSGKFHLQAFARPGSTEMRLIGHKPLDESPIEMQTIACSALTRFMNFINQNVRPAMFGTAARGDVVRACSLSGKVSQDIRKYDMDLLMWETRKLALTVRSGRNEYEQIQNIYRRIFGALITSHAAQRKMRR